MPILETFTKQPADVQDYDIDFAEYLDGLADTAATDAVTADPGITVMSHTVIGKTVKVWLSGGVHLGRYKVTVRLTTAGGRVKEVEILILVREV